MDIKQHINDWIERLSDKHVVLGGFSICPYAKTARYELIETDGSDIDPPPWAFDILIYVLPNNWSTEELFELASIKNSMFPDLVFLPDHKDRITEIKGVQTNNGKYNLLLCQWRHDLEDARKKLIKSDYYSYWDEVYLKEILST